MTPALAHRYLTTLVYGAPEQFAAILPQEQFALQKTAAWFSRQRLASWVYKQCQQTSSDSAVALATLLQPAYFNTAMQNRLHFDALTAILRAFQEEQIPVTLLKGAALAQAAYGSLEARPMGDVDLWLRDWDMARAVQILTTLGFRQANEKETRPLALQQLSRGEIQFAHPNWQSGLVELHWSGFPGWWLQRTAVIDDEAIWRRTLPLSLPDWDETDGDAHLLRRLSPEDMVIQLAVHQAVSSQFGTRPVGGLLDLALAVKCWPVDWALLAERAQRRRVGVVLWLVLHLTQALIGLPGVETALARLRPAPLRRFLLRRLVDPDSIAAAADLRHGRWRYLLLLLLIDRPRDMLRLLYRAVWPEPEWLAARYGSDASRARHIRQMLRFGQF